MGDYISKELCEEQAEYDVNHNLVIPLYKIALPMSTFTWLALPFTSFETSAVTTPPRVSMVNFFPEVWP